MRVWLLDFGLVAQLVEQRTENPRAGGSIPSLATIIFFTKTSRFNRMVKVLSAMSEDDFLHKSH